jgi:hypothetical protein
VPRKVFVAGEILTAADVNANLMDQAVMVFNDAAARDTAIPSPIEGMVVYLKDTDGLLSYSGTAWVPAASGASLGAGSILQVVQTLKTNVFTSTSDTYENVPGTSVTITPRATSSKVLLLGSVAIGSNTTTAGRSAFVRLSGGNTSAYIGDGEGNRTPALGSNGNYASEWRQQNSQQITPIAFLDSPATTSATTYQLQVRRATGDTAVIGRSGSDTDAAAFGRYPTTLIAMEVAG